MALRVAFRPRPFICCGCLRLSPLRSSLSPPKRRLSSSQTAASDTTTTSGAGVAAGNTRSGTHGSSLAAQSTSTGKSASEHDSTNIETRSSDLGAGSAQGPHNRDRPPPQSNHSSEAANGPRIGKLLVDLRTAHGSRRRLSDQSMWAALAFAFPLLCVFQCLKNGGRRLHIAKRPVMWELSMNNISPYHFFFCSPATACFTVTTAFSLGA
jgi:hypothetical protein